MKKQQIPTFKNEDEEREFWATHDSTGFLDWSKAKRTVFPNLKPSAKSISLRLPESVLALIRTGRKIANQNSTQHNA